MIEVLFFGRFGDLAQGVPGAFDLTDEVSTPARIRDGLQRLSPELTAELNQPQVPVAVNQQVSSWDTQLSDGDEVAFLPPVTGG